MAFRKPIAVIFITLILMAIGVFAFAAQRSSNALSVQPSAPALTPAAASSQITVTSPASGSNWPAGSSQKVAWSYSGNIGSSVSIRLLKGTSTVYTLTNGAVSNINGKGTFAWTVPQDAAAGTNYTIVVASNSNPNIKGTSGFFSLTGSVAKIAASVAAAKKLNLPPGIEILTPHSGDKWPSGETHELKWRVTGIAVDPKTMVKVRMTSWDWPDIYDVWKDIPMTESYTLKLTTPPGQKAAEYRIAASIVDPATNQKYESVIEGIDIGFPYIQVTNLAELTAAPWVPGKTYKINWKVRGSGYTGGVTFSITDTSGANTYISSTMNVGNSGTYEWTAKAFAGKMKFSITPQKTTVEGTSFVFNVETGKYPTLSPALTAPAAPSLSATLIDYKQHVDLQWKDNSGNEKEFVIERKHIGGKRSSYEEIGRTSANATSYQDKAIATAGPYRYRVKAVNDNGSSTSNEADITTMSPAPPVDLVPVNPHPEKGKDGYCPAVAYTGDIDLTIRNLGPGQSGETNAVLVVYNKKSSGYFEQLKTVVPVLQKNESFIWHAHAAKCLEGDLPECEFNLMINYNPKEVLESDMSTNDIYFTCKGPVKIKKTTMPVVK
jgi:hypothetical protein